MSGTCATLIRGRALRVTKVDACGVRVLGPTSQVVTEGFITVSLTANIDEGTTIDVTNASGNKCIFDEPAPKFLNYTVEVALCGVDPELFNLMANTPLVMDAAGENAVGFRVNSSVDADAVGFALEMWSNVPASACDDGNPAWGYFLLPFLKGGNLGDFTVGNDAVNFTLSNAKTKDGSGWGVGPYDVVWDEDDLPGPLNEAITDSDHLHMEITNVEPPTAQCGAQALGVPATGATAGTPGTYTPANSYGPANLAGLTGVTASPNTAWTTGQRVVLRDGSLAHWNGTTWVAGAA